MTENKIRNRASIEKSCSLLRTPESVLTTHDCQNFQIKPGVEKMIAGKIKWSL